VPFQTPTDVTERTADLEDDLVPSWSSSGCQMREFKASPMAPIVYVQPAKSHSEFLTQLWIGQAKRWKVHRQCSLWIKWA